METCLLIFKAATPGASSRSLTNRKLGQVSVNHAYVIFQREKIYGIVYEGSRYSAAESTYVSNIFITLVTAVTEQSYKLKNLHKICGFPIYVHKMWMLKTFKTHWPVSLQTFRILNISHQYSEVWTIHWLPIQYGIDYKLCLLINH